MEDSVVDKIKRTERLFFPRFKSELRDKSCADLAELRICVRPSVSGFIRDWYKVIYRQIFSRHQKFVNIAWALF
jgi:hypothetical protein